MEDREITQKDIAAVCGGILSRAQEELRSMTQEDLERYWFFEYNVCDSKEWNLYRFHSLLELYRGHCRRWEEMHHGSCCVVERVRDKYLMPKIEQFILDFEKHHE